MDEARTNNSDETVRRYPKGEIEEPLRVSLERLGITDGKREYEVGDDDGRLVTVPDFAWPDARVAVYCDGYAYHGNPDTLELDARRRTCLQSRDWVVLTFWGRTILRDPEGCARQVAEVLRSRRRQSELETSKAT